MTSLDSLTLVDDLDNRVVYSPGWQVFTGGAEVDGTKHGAAEAGMTASFNFTGTLVSVKGSLGSVDVYGIPTTSYSIDGTPLLNYTAPVIAPGGFQLNVTFFTSPTLSPGNHQLTITNLNGTAPNVFWLDYILYAPSILPSSASSTPSQTSLSTSASRAPSVTSLPSGSPAPAHGVNIGAIVGGVVGGAAFIAIFACLLWWFLRRGRMRRGMTSEIHGPVSEIQPFTSPSRAPVAQNISLLSPTYSTKSATLLHHAAPGADAPAPAALSRPGYGHQPLSGTAVFSIGAGEPLVQQVDSGMRLVDGEDSLPPPYVRD